VQTASALLELTEAVFCPNCKTEYREGFSRCSDCGADLVRELSGRGNRESGEFTELVWMGSNSFAHVAVRKLLSGAGIKFSDMPPGDYMLFPASFNASQIYVSRNDLAPARMLIDEQFVERDEDSEQAKIENSNVSEPEESPQDDPNESEVPPDVAKTVPANWNPRFATCKIWDADLLDSMRQSLVENGIGCQLVPDGESDRLMIYPADERRAREIIREIFRDIEPG
jgi:hypothetical protein